MNYKTLKVESKSKDDTDTLKIDPKQLIPILETNFKPSLYNRCELGILNGGKLDGHAIFLPATWDWVIGEDAVGRICLVPLRKDLEDIEGKLSEELQKLISALANSDIDRCAYDDIIEKLEQHERLQAAVTKHLERYGR